MPVARLPVPKTYAALRRGVEAVVLKGRAQIERAWVQTYHECGRLIHEHLLLKKERASYGAYLFRQLSRDTGVDIRTLQQSVQFYKYFPIARHGAQLSWAHYRALVQIENETARDRLHRDAVRHGWTSTHLIERVRALNAAAHKDELRTANSELRLALSGTPPSALSSPLPTASASVNRRPLTPKRGTVGICRLVEDDDGLAVDLGFTSHWRLTPTQARGLAAGAFVDVSDPKASNGVIPAPDATKSDLYTYRAEVLRVVDGDTLWLKVHLAPDLWLKEKVRLRGIDCPELDTPEGKTAKAHVTALLAEADEVTVVTTKPDKYDRYLADVFVPRAGDGDDSGEDVFLNNALLAHGHAVRKDEYAPSDWEESG